MLKQSLLWTFAGALAVAVVWRTANDEVRTEQAAAPELFPFIRALPVHASETARVAPAEAGHEVAVAVQQEDAGKLLAANAYRVEEAVRSMRAQGASDDEVYRARAAALSAEHAAELARRDREEATWQQRVAAYLAQRQSIAADLQAIRALRDGLFSAEEQERLAAYEPSVLPVTGTP